MQGTYEAKDTRKNKESIMINRLTIIIVSTVIATTAQNAAAGIGVTPKIGTLGYGADVTVSLIPQLNARAGFNTFSYEYTHSEEDGSGDLTAKIDFQNIPLLLDWHPTAGAFRISAGVVVNNNKVLLSANPGDSVDFNDIGYVVESASGEASFKQMSPYLGIGTGNAADTGSRVHFAADFGVMFQGSPKIDLSAAAANPALQSELDNSVKAEQKKLEDDTSAFTIYPVIALGISFTF